MEPQLNKLVEASCNLESIGCGVNDKTLIYIIIMALPNALSMLKSILFNKDDMMLTSKVVISQILVDEEHRVHASGGTATAYFAKARKKPSRQGTGKGRDRDQDQNCGDHEWDNSEKCTHCNRTGHEVLECWMKKKDDEDKNKSSSAPKANSGSSGKSSNVKANVATVQDDVIHLFQASTADEDPTESAYTSHSDLSDKTLLDMWLIDSGASCIMCSHRHWFRQFTPLPKPIKVVLDDNSSIPATGSRQILVCMNTGNGYKSTVLQDMLYVPDLNGNLLSVSHFAHHRSEV